LYRALLLYQVQDIRNEIRIISKVPSTSLHRVKCYSSRLVVRVVTRATFAFDACFVWKLVTVADERNGFYRKNIATINAIDHVFNVAISYLALCRPSTSLQRLIHIDGVNRRDRFSMKKLLRSSARGASFHTEHA
jgi:hypothetical protein